MREDTQGQDYKKKPQNRKYKPGNVNHNTGSQQMIGSEVKTISKKLESNWNQTAEMHLHALKNFLLQCHWFYWRYFTDDLANMEPGSWNTSLFLHLHLLQY